MESLTKLGSEKTEYKLSGPDRSMLETFPNPSPDDSDYHRYVIRHYTEEFTSLCPKTGQPDFATVWIDYIADKTCVESKSLKLYLFSYRNEGAFMEAICNKIADDLWMAMDPMGLQVTMAFGARGGIETSVVAARGEVVPKVWFTK